MKKTTCLSRIYYLPFTRDLCLILQSVRLCVCDDNYKSKPSSRQTFTRERASCFKRRFWHLRRDSSVHLSLSLSLCELKETYRLLGFLPAPTSMDRVRMRVCKCALYYFSGARSHILTSLFTRFCLWLCLHRFYGRSDKTAQLQGFLLWVILDNVVVGSNNCRIFTEEARMCLCLVRKPKGNADFNLCTQSRMSVKPGVQMLFEASWFTSVWLECSMWQCNIHIHAHKADTKRGRDTGKHTLRHLSLVWSTMAGMLWQKRKCYLLKKTFQVSSGWMQMMQTHARVLPLYAVCRLQSGGNRTCAHTLFFLLLQ